MQPAIVLIALLAVAGDSPTAADHLTLSTGETVLGQVLPTSDSRRLRMAVSRAWARNHLPQQLDSWQHAADGPAQQARVQRLDRLQSWLADRPNSPDDPLRPGIEREIDRLTRNPDLDRTLLIEIAFDRRRVTRIERAPDSAARLLRLAWIAGLSDPEDLATSDLRDRLAGRNVAVDTDDPAAIDGLLDPKLQSEADWTLLRALTEVKYDQSVRFIRYQDLLLPDTASLETVNLSDALPALLGPALGLGTQNADPLRTRLSALSSSGRVGVLVTQLALDPLQGNGRVEVILYARHPTRGWTAAWQRSIPFRAGAADPADAAALQAAPQVEQILSLAQGLGLASAEGETARRSLMTGAAVRQALGQARQEVVQLQEKYALRLD